MGGHLIHAHKAKNILYGYLPDIEYCEGRLSYIHVHTAQNHNGHPNLKRALYVTVLHSQFSSKAINVINAPWVKIK
jgi:hypothetical protein